MAILLFADPALALDRLCLLGGIPLKPDPELVRLRTAMDEADENRAKADQYWRATWSDFKQANCDKVPRSQWSALCKKYDKEIDEWAGLWGSWNSSHINSAFALADYLQQHAKQRQQEGEKVKTCIAAATPKPAVAQKPTPAPQPAPGSTPSARGPSSSILMTVYLGNAAQSKDLNSDADAYPRAASTKLQSGPQKYTGSVVVVGTLPPDYIVYVFHHSHVHAVLGANGGQFTVSESKGFGASNDVIAMACKAGKPLGYRDVPEPCILKGNHHPTVMVDWIP